MRNKILEDIHMTPLQEKELEILNQIIVILERHHLRYYAVGGTCIGAVRHHGFIPWDDDIDIAMPREDYELFRTQFYRELPEKYQKLDCDNSVSSTHLYMKIYDSTTTFIEEHIKTQPDCYTGVFVDIMVLDGLPKTGFQKVIKKSQWMLRMNHLVRKMPSDYRQQRGTIKYLIRKCLSVCFRYNYFSDKWRQLLERYPYDQSSLIYFGYQTQTKNHGPLPHSFFASYQSVPFEDIEIRVPENYDGYLTDRYGDYMPPPPPEKRNSGHIAYILDLGTPCSFYKEQQMK